MNKQSPRFFDYKYIGPHKDLQGKLCRVLQRWMQAGSNIVLVEFLWGERMAVLASEIEYLLKEAENGENK